MSSAYRINFYIVYREERHRAQNEIRPECNLGKWSRKCVGVALMGHVLCRTGIQFILRMGEIELRLLYRADSLFLIQHAF